MYFKRNMFMFRNLIRSCVYGRQRKIKSNVILLSSWQGFPLCGIFNVFHVLQNISDPFTDIVFYFPKYQTECCKRPCGISSPAIAYQKLYQASELQLGQRTSSKLNSGMHQLPQDAVKGFVTTSRGTKATFQSTLSQTFAGGLNPSP